MLRNLSRIFRADTTLIALGRSALLPAMSPVPNRRRRRAAPLAHESKQADHHQHDRIKPIILRISECLFENFSNHGKRKSKAVVEMCALAFRPPPETHPEYSQRHSCAGPVPLLKPLARPS
jgi:hypothetical protein